VNVSEGSVYLADRAVHSCSPGFGGNDAGDNRTPRKYITKWFGNLSKVQMVYRMYCLGLDTFFGLPFAAPKTKNGISSSIETGANNSATLIRKNLRTKGTEIAKLKTNTTTIDVTALYTAVKPISTSNYHTPTEK
jgi:hypothetical protein